MHTLAQPVLGNLTVADNGAGLDMEAFQQSDWEQALDLLQDPTQAQLRAHLAGVPPEEASGETAQFLARHLAELAATSELATA